MRTRLSADARRRSLQDAAEQQLLECGYLATRLEDVARRAGVSRQLLQRHFPTKRDLYVSLLERHRDGLLSILGQVPASAAADAQAIRDAARAWFGYVEQHPFVASFLFDDATGDPHNAQRHREMRDAARQALQRLLSVQLPEAPDIEIEILAEMIRSSAVGLARWHATGPQLTAEQLADTAVDTWRAAVLCR